MCAWWDPCGLDAYVAFALIFFIIIWGTYKLLYLLEGGPVIRVFFIQILWSLPFVGIRMKAESIRRKVEEGGVDGGTFAGETKGWDFKELRAKKNYADCARDFYESPISFWRRTIIELCIAWGITILIF